MSKTHRERILDYLWSISPEMATNSQIRDGTGIRSHQQVYLLTRDLMYAGLIRGEQRGREWVFWADESIDAQFTSPGRAAPGKMYTRAEREITWQVFEDLTQTVMSTHFGVPLTPGEVPGVPKRFDLVSPDKGIVGDAKYLTLVRGQRLPPASSPSLPNTSGCWRRLARRFRFSSLGTTGRFQRCGFSVTATWRPVLPFTS